MSKEEFAGLFEAMRERGDQEGKDGRGPEKETAPP
jgi:hypothetical protein